MAKKPPIMPPPPGMPKGTPATPPPGGSKFAERLFEAHLQQLRHLVEQRGAGGLKRLYKEARADLYDKLLSVSPKDRRASPTALRAMLGQVEGTMELFGRKLGEHLTDVGKTAADLGARHAVNEYKLLETHFKGTTPVLDLERAAVFRGMIDDVEKSLLRRHKLTSSTWSYGAIASMEKSLSLSTMLGKPLDESIREVMAAGGIADEEAWKAERIVRTETAYAHGATKFAAMQKTQEELGMPLHKRLIETFDDRTGDDSFLQHGQTVPLDEPFNWKHKVGGVWKVTEYMFPPNRPNDRAVVIPWDPSWEETDEERPLSRAELNAAEPTRWRKTVGVDIPPGHRPGRPYKG